MVEGGLDDIFKLVRDCHDKMRGRSKRVITTLKIDDREGATGRIKGKTDAVERHLGRELKK